MIDSILTTSTCDITLYDVQLLEKEKTFSIGKFDYGFFIFVENTLHYLNKNITEYSESFKEILSFASQLNCIYLCLDQNADSITELQTFDQ